jgi:hypothetical protein
MHSELHESHRGAEPNVFEDAGGALRRRVIDDVIAVSVQVIVTELTYTGTVYNWSERDPANNFVCDARRTQRRGSNENGAGYHATGSERPCP